MINDFFLQYSNLSAQLGFPLVGINPLQNPSVDSQGGFPNILTPILNQNGFPTVVGENKSNETLNLPFDGNLSQGTQSLSENGVLAGSINIPTVMSESKNKLEDVPVENKTITSLKRFNNSGENKNIDQSVNIFYQPNFIPIDPSSKIETASTLDTTKSIENLPEKTEKHLANISTQSNLSVQLGDLSDTTNLSNSNVGEATVDLRKGTIEGGNRELNPSSSTKMESTSVVTKSVDDSSSVPLNLIDPGKNTDNNNSGNPENSMDKNKKLSFQVQNKLKISLTEKFQPKIIPNDQTNEDGTAGSLAKLPINDSPLHGAGAISLNTEEGKNVTSSEKVGTSLSMVNHSSGINNQNLSSGDQASLLKIEGLSEKNIQSTSTNTPSLNQNRTVHEQPVLDQISRHLQILSQSNKSEISMTLDPKELGKVKLHLSLKDDGLSVQFQVENQDVKEIIQSHNHELKESMSQHGIHVQNLNVNVNNGNGFYPGQNTENPFYKKYFANSKSNGELQLDNSELDTNLFSNSKQLVDCLA